jgi:hypothetical protein
VALKGSLRATLLAILQDKTYLASICTGLLNLLLGKDIMAIEQ